MDELKEFLDAVLDWLEKKSLPHREAGHGTGQVFVAPASHFTTQ